MDECGFTGCGDGPIFDVKLVEQAQCLLGDAQDSSQDFDILTGKYFPKVLQA